MPVRKSSETKLLDAVDELVFTHSIETTPVDAVLARAGVSAATLYRGFSSKEALIAAALDRRQRRWQETWDRAIAAADSPEQRVLAVFDALDEVAGGDHAVRWCAFLGAAAEYADPPAEIAGAVSADTDHLRRTLRLLTAELPGDDPDGLAEAILLVVTGELAMRLRPGEHTGPARLSTVARDIAATLIGAAAADGRPPG